MNSMKKIISYITAIVLTSALAGCSHNDEKSYEYYAAHPAELYHDYNYCSTHPSANICFNIIQKYFKYQKNSSSDKHGTISSGYIFRGIDEPVASFGTNKT